MDQRNHGDSMRIPPIAKNLFVHHSFILTSIHITLPPTSNLHCSFRHYLSPLTQIFTSAITLVRITLSPMAEASNDAKDIEKLYVYGERLSEAKDKSQSATTKPHHQATIFKPPPQPPPQLPPPQLPPLQPPPPQIWRADLEVMKGGSFISRGPQIWWRWWTTTDLVEVVDGGRSGGSGGWPWSEKEDVGDFGGSGGGSRWLWWWWKPTDVVVLVVEDGGCGGGGGEDGEREREKREGRET
ncbi:hypothetical protein OSB04_001974 [Centaurea solstitialis]|uniref:Uncharacterized protein n=1 Tax=Centaurea solstitialis TaxID=347529 RepID=A0AA38TRZ6_9ASTR|nr:hypothetical protein OSB04_001974 [Centaurea solstitialis]